MEGVHRIIIGLAIETGQLVEIEFGNLRKARIGGQEVGRTLEPVPKSRISHIQMQTLFGIVRHHTAIARQYGMHAQLLHTGQYLFLEFLLTTVPGEWQRSTPPFEVVHLPPGKEGRPCDELPYLLFRIAEFQEHIAPHALLTDDGQGQIDTMQRHPVDLLLPALPVPEGHRIRECAVVEVVSQREVGLVTLLLTDDGEYGRELRLHLIPGEVDAGIVFQIPVDARGDVHPGVAPHHDLRPFLIKFEEILFALDEFGLELRRGSLVDSLQQIINGIRPSAQAQAD